MVESDVPAEMSGTRRTFPRIVMSLGFGLVVGAVTYYVTAVAAAVQISGNFANAPLTFAMIAIVSALSVVVGWRWPIVGLTAGIVIIAVVAWAVTERMGWSPANGALNPHNAVALGAMSVAPTIVGATMVTASALRLRSRRTQ